MLEYVLFGIAIGIGLMLIVTICYKRIFVGYTVENGTSEKEVSSHKVMKVWKNPKGDNEGYGWHILCEGAVFYDLPRSTKIKYVEQQKDRCLVREFYHPVVIRKRWFHKDKEEYLPVELVECLYLMKKDEENNCSREKSVV